MFSKINIFVLFLILASLLFGGDIFASDRLAGSAVPVRFYGKLLDQDGAAIADADVFLQLWGRETLNGGKTVQVKTDSNGLFQLQDTGTSLDIRAIKKQGYDFETTTGNTASRLLGFY